MKVAVGLSGGVDSSLSAHLLKEAGHELTGVFLECWRGPGCRAEEDRKDALAVALDLGIPFRVLDFKQAYKERVVDIFFRDYARGLTPNPDIWCNTEIKFGLFYQWALQNGFDAVATGHYAQVQSQDGLPTLVSGVDPKKDQTYFLYRLEQEQLEHILFPVGHLLKSQVREEAAKRQIPVAAKPDSQGICFIGDIDVSKFLEDELGEKPGNVLDVEGNVVGTHRGIWFYTVGQRHGFELFPKIHTVKEEWKHVLPPLYVISKDAESNTITVGYGAETVSESISLADVFWRDPAWDILGLSERESLELFIKIRHGGQKLRGTFTWKNREKGFAEVRLEDPQRGIAPGQSVVFHDPTDAGICWGGAVIA